MYPVAKIAVDKAAYSFDKGYDYLVPSAMVDKIKPGARVVVSFGNSRKRQGVVLELSQVEDTARLKEIQSLIDEEPLLSKEMLELMGHLKEQTFCTYYDAFRGLIPRGIGVTLRTICTLQNGDIPLTDEEQQVVSYLQAHKGKADKAKILAEVGLPPQSTVIDQLAHKGVLSLSDGVKRKILDERITMVRQSETPPVTEKPIRFTEKQKLVLQFLQQHKTASVKETAYYCGVTKTVVERLVEKGYLIAYERMSYRSPIMAKQEQAVQEIVLTQEQEEVYGKLCFATDRDTFGVNLLYGVTGSGKTQVFLKLIEHVVKKGKTVIVMVPEISLTPQTIEKFVAQFGHTVAVMHSGLALSERMDEWKRIKNGEARIVVGTRSAVFAPVENIGLIVMDEEQEHTYKSEQSPRYHARDIAKLRCRYHKAQLLLCSATPSLESFYAAKKGRYQLLTLKNRYGQAVLPDVYILDMRDRRQNGLFSETLVTEMYHNLQQKEQTILLLNRRGYNTLVRCSSCSAVASCPNCSIALTFHQANNRLICHCCGYTADLMSKCKECGSQFMQYSGVGTQRVEEELQSLFPTARILRMDMDTTMSKLSYEQKFTAFLKQEYDIMIGTQMVAKGHHFPKVTLVGVLSADQSLYTDDFRSFEKTFSLITQVVGRCGRAELPGRAIIQTFTPENPVIKQAATQDYDAFFEDEIESRKLHLYPPFCDICMVGFVCADPKKVKEGALWFTENLKTIAKTTFGDLPIRLLGPCEPAVARANGKYRYHLVVKCRTNSRLREMLSQALSLFEKQRGFQTVTAYLDFYYDGNM